MNKVLLVVGARQLRAISRLLLCVYASAVASVDATAQKTVNDPGLGDISATFEGDVEQQNAIDAFGRRDGLSSLSINALEFDADGFLWLGTSGGLFRFDGLEFYQVPLMGFPSGRESRILDVKCDGRGDLWVVIADGSAARLNGATFEVPPGLDALGRVLNLARTSDGALWICGDQIARYSAEGHFEVVYSRHGENLNLEPGLPTDPDLQATTWLGHERVDSATEDPHTGDIYFSSRAGTLVYRPSGRLELVSEEPMAGRFIDSLGHHIECFIGGEVRVDGKAIGQHEDSESVVKCAIEVSPGRTFITTDRAAFIVDLSNGPPALRESDFGCRVRDILPVGDGSVAVAADPHGLWFVRKRPYDTVGLLEGSSRSPVGAMANVGEGLGLIDSFEGRGVSVLDLDEPIVPGEATEFFAWPVEGQGLYDARRLSGGDVLLGTSKGLVQLTGNGLTQMGFRGHGIEAVLEAPDGHLWLRYLDVLHEYEYPSLEPTGRTVPAGGQWNEDMVVVSGSLLRTETTRVVRMNFETLQEEVLVAGLEANARALFPEANGDLWITTYGAGLYRLGSNGSIAHWSVAEDLPDRFLGWVGSVPGETEHTHLWINSNRGVMRVSRASLDAVASGAASSLDCQLISTPEGNGIAGFATERGELILPTMEGPVTVLAEAAQWEVKTPTVALEAIWDGEEPVQCGAPITGNPDVAFDIRVIYFPSSRLVELQYRLDGLDADWINAHRQRRLRYRNLRPGDYSLRLRARVPGGAFGEEVVSGLICIRGHWYQSVWARLLAAAGVAGAIALIGALRVRTAKRRSRYLEEEVKRREVVETKLRVQRAQFESVLEGANDGILAFDVDGRILYANPAVHWIFGASTWDLVDRDVSSLGIPGAADHAELQELIAEVQDAGAWQTIQGPSARFGGEPFEIELSVASDGQSFNRCYVAIVRDVSERTRMLDQLRMSEERYRLLFHTTPSSIVAWRASMEPLEWNDGAAELFGWDGSNEAGTVPAPDRSMPTLLDLMDGADAVERMRAAVRQVIVGGEELFLVVSTIAQGDQTRKCRWHLAPLAEPERNSSAFISSVLDMSEEERIHAEFQSLRRKLARAEETERARIARELHDDLSQRLAALALDVRLTESATRSGEYASIPAALSALREGIEVLGTDVHALSRRLHPAVLDDLGLSAAIRSECTRRQQAHSVSVKFQDRAGVDEIRGEVGLTLFRVVQEAIGNALRHGDPEDIVVFTRCRDAFLELGIQDNGTGFDVGCAPSGGIGLASMRERMALVGGQLEVRSRADCGTTVLASLQWETASVAPPIGSPQLRRAAPPR